MALIDKNAKINKFIADVLNPALGAAAYHAGNVDTGDYQTPVESLTNYRVNPANPPIANTFGVVPPLGGFVSSTELAAIFQIYAYRLSSIRRAAVYRLNTSGGTVTGSTLIANGITCLSQTYCMDIGTFNSRVQAATNPLLALAPPNIATAASIDALIARLRSVLANHRLTSPVITLNVCHSSCHSSCHGSRGRR